MSRSLLRYDDLEEPQPPRWQVQAGPIYSHSNGNGSGSYAHDAHKRKRRSDGTRAFKKQRSQHGVWDPEASAAAAAAAQNGTATPVPEQAAEPEVHSRTVPPPPRQAKPAAVVEAEEEAQGAEPEAEGEGEWAGEAEEEYWDGEAYDEEEAEDENRVLTHAEIWDDRALIGAWEAAVDEYDAFRVRRAEVLASNLHAHPLPQRDNKAPGVALWYEAPPPGSKQALSAFEMGRAYAAERKAASAVGGASVEMALPAPPSPAPVPAPSTQVPAPPNGEAAAHENKPRALKGTLPPSSKIEGSAAWHAACAIISRTPNRIAGQELPVPSTPAPEAAVQASAVEAPAASASPAAAVPAPAVPTDPELIQNLCMSWYYAGYYQAQLSAQQAQQPQ